MCRVRTKAPAWHSGPSQSEGFLMSSVPPRWLPLNSLFKLRPSLGSRVPSIFSLARALTWPLRTYIADPSLGSDTISLHC